ncbi:MAG: YqjF family protein [Coraliomargaritaceae bacterium]
MSAVSQAIRNDPWVIAQRWTHVLFLSYPVDPEVVQARLPTGLEVDTVEGRAWLSVVPFFMSHIRFPITPGVGWVRLRELNLRTYVRYRGRPGVYFFTLDTDNWLGHWVARTFFHLPYRMRQLSGSVSERKYRFESAGSMQVQAQIGAACESSPLDRWLVERYSLFTRGRDSFFRGDVLHEPWQLNRVSDLEVSESLSEEFGFSSTNQWHARYAAVLDVRFRPFTKLL